MIFLNISSVRSLLNDCKRMESYCCLVSLRLDRNKSKNTWKHLVIRELWLLSEASSKAQKQLKDYEIINELKNNQSFTHNNEILKNELPLLLDDLTTELEEIIMMYIPMMIQEFFL